jgi:NAD(P) transhydrogenase subunit alpha
MGGGASFKVDLENEVVRRSLVLHNGTLMWPPPKQEVAAPPTVAAAKPAATVATFVKAPPRRGIGTVIALGIAAVALIGLGLVAPPSFLSHLTVFALACVVGWQVVWNVTPALHTPLMSVTNAISGIIVIGGLLQVSGPLSQPAVLIGAVAILLATINIAGGFLVTQRMLRMFVRR